MSPMVVVCRLCLNLTDIFCPISYLNLLLKAVLPDVDLTLTKDPVVCKQCADSVTSSFNFKYNCMEQEKKIQKHYNETKNPVNLYGLVEKSCCTIASDTKNGLVVKRALDVKVVFPCENPDKIKQEYYENHVKNGMEEIKESDMSNVIEILESDIVDLGDDESDYPNNIFIQELPCNLPNNNGKFDSEADKIVGESRQSPAVELVDFGCSKIKQKKNNIRKIKSSSCTLCQKMFRQKINLYGHLLKKHQDVPGIEKMIKTKIHYCQYCSYQTINNFTFTQHLVNKHNMPFKSKNTKMFCAHCEYSTTTRGNLMLHVRTHYSMKWYRCNFCEQSFHQKANLDKHILSLHSGSDNTGKVEKISTIPRYRNRQCKKTEEKHLQKCSRIKICQAK